MEVNKYETRVILEALHNCIAHQDYHLKSRILVTEKIDKLIFTNAGDFFEGKAEDYVTGEKTPQRYRNYWLAQAMANLGMIDTMGYGIHNMFLEQKKKYFPMPEYDLSEKGIVKLEVFGHIIDEKYTKLLMEKADLPLSKVIALDSVQKGKPISEAAAKELKKEGLIEGRKPNFYISAKIAQRTGEKAKYSKYKGFDNKYYQDLIIKAIKEHGFLERKDIDELLVDKLPGWMNDVQKKGKVNKILTEMRAVGKIKNEGSDTKSKWVIAD